MDAVKFLKTKKRMCELYICSECPLGMQNNKRDVTCDEYIKTYTEEAVAVVEDWEKEHPIKTMLTDFLEKYPNALLEGDGAPQICPHELGYEKLTCEYKAINCVDCWNRPLE